MGLTLYVVAYFAIGIIWTAGSVFAATNGRGLRAGASAKAFAYLFTTVTWPLGFVYSVSYRLSK